MLTSDTGPQSGAHLQEALEELECPCALEWGGTMWLVYPYEADVSP